MTKPKPIPFSGPMVRAILEGRKTQTRRVLKRLEKGQYRRQYPIYWDGKLIGGSYPDPVTESAPYDVGDLLWVREAWRAHAEWDAVPPRDIPPGSPVQYLADEPLSPWLSRYRHARFMPFWASRITLRVTDVRVQRVQDISEEDAIAEGVARARFPEQTSWGWPQERFRQLWNDLHGPDAWDENPWVAAYTFERVQEEADAGPT